MIAKQAKEIALQWVIEEAAGKEGVRGAFLHGSINWLPDSALLPSASDVDVMVVLDDTGRQNTPGKRLYRGALIDVSYQASDQFQSADQVLGVSHLAGSLRAASVLLDTSGQLAKLQAQVAREYARRSWVTRRCEHARDKVLMHLSRLEEAESFHDQVTAWLFGTGVTTHMLLAAGLRNPTVRTRYAAVRELLKHYGHTEFYETLLGLLGCARMNRAQVEQHLAALTGLFDYAKTVIKTPFPFAADISDLARPVAIGGSWELIERGEHREAVFWIAATYARCLKVLAHDAPPAMQERFQAGFWRLLGNLGIGSFADLRRRSQQVKETLPWVWEVAEAIMATNLEIEN